MNQRFWSWLLIGACLFTTTACENDKQSAGGEGSQEGRLQKVTLMLNWFPEAEHGGFYAAKLHGIYEKYGLDVTIEPGGPNAPVAQELLTGRVQFAIGNADDVLVFREQEVPVVALMAPIQDTPRCILVHPDSGAKTLSDLKGLTLQAGNGRPYLEYMKAKGLLEGVKVVPYSGVPNFVANKNSAMQGYNFSEPLLASQSGVDAKLLMVSEIGFNPYSSCLLATEDYIAENQDLVARTVVASREGWKKYFESPDETNAAILKENKHGMTPEALEFGVRELRPLCITDSVPADEVGMMTAERWSTLVDQFRELGLLEESKVSAADVFTTDFINRTSATD